MSQESKQSCLKSDHSNQDDSDRRKSVRFVDKENSKKENVQDQDPDKESRSEKVKCEENKIKHPDSKNSGFEEIVVPPKNPKTSKKKNQWSQSDDKKLLDIFNELDGRLSKANLEILTNSFPDLKQTQIRYRLKKLLKPHEIKSSKKFVQKITKSQPTAPPSQPKNPRKRRKKAKNPSTHTSQPYKRKSHQPYEPPTIGQPSSPPDLATLENKTEANPSHFPDDSLEIIEVASPTSTAPALSINRRNLKAASKPPTSLCNQLKAALDQIGGYHSLRQDFHDSLLQAAHSAISKMDTLYQALEKVLELAGKVYVEAVETHNNRDIHSNIRDIHNRENMQIPMRENTSRCHRDEASQSTHATHSQLTIEQGLLNDPSKLISKYEGEDEEVKKEARRRRRKKSPYVKTRYRND